MRNRALYGLATLVLVVVAGARADHWPTYLGDNARSGITNESIETPMTPVWTFVPNVPPDPAWTQPAKEAARVRFDDSLHVAVADGRVFFGSSGDNQVYALDATNGRVLWRFFTGGPVRLAPTVSGGKVYFGSDDGYAYCLDAANGEVVWKRMAADNDDRVIGHGRMMSLWPVRTGVIVTDGVAYFGAGVFPSESVYISAVDANDGTPIWRNDVTGERGPEQQYDGISPQGYLLANQATLYVPSGRSMPSAFERATGKFLFNLRPGGKVGGTYALLTGEHLVAGINEQRTYDPSTGETQEGGYAWSPAHRLIVKGGISYSLADHELTALDRSKYSEYAEKRKDVKSEAETLRREVRSIYRKRYYLKEDAPDYQAQYDALSKELDATLEKVATLEERQRDIESGAYLWRRENDCRDAMILAGETLFTGGEERVLAIDARSGEWQWTGSVEGRASGLAVAEGQLFVSTNAGTIHCFRPGDPESIRDRVSPDVRSRPFDDDELTLVYRRAAEQILAETDMERGFCLVLGCGEGRLALELAKRTEWSIYGISEDAEQVARAREALNAAGVYGARVTIDHGSLEDLPYPDYFANVIVSDDVLMNGTINASAEEVVRVLRPLGGEIVFAQPDAADGVSKSLDEGALDQWLATSGEGQWDFSEQYGSVARFARGALPGSGSWTHQYANPANTSNSGDERIKTPLGVLWFGEPGPERMMERHGRAAAPVSVDGRLFVQGENVVMAFDSYNGTKLWQRELPGAVRARADVDGSNMAVSDDGLFVATRDEAVRLDVETGETIRRYPLPASANGARQRWGTLYVVGKTLYGSTASPLREEYGANWRNPSEDPIDNLNAYRQYNANGGMWRTMQRWPDWGREDTWKGALTGRMISSESFFALDVETGEERWSVEGDIGHTTIAFGEGVVFLMDNEVTESQRTEAIRERQEAYGNLTFEEPEKDDAALYDVRRVMAIDTTTGVPQWQRVIDLTGSGGDKLGAVYFDGLLVIFGHYSNHDGSQFSKGGLSWRRVTTVSAEDGSNVWSKELNYLRRPFLIGNQLIVEPRSVDVRTGEWRMRYHPVTGDQVPWEFKRGGHSCGICTASTDTFFFRSDSINYYDFNQDEGMLPIGGMRAGCWINMIMSGGVALLPEASAGCTCSFPIRSTVCMAPKTKDRSWTIFASPGPLTPVEHLHVNLGAPGDRKDPEGNLWFNYPRLGVGYGVKFSLNEEVAPGLGGYASSFEAVEIQNTGIPWVFSSGIAGLRTCRLPVLGEGDAAATYTVRLGFCEPVHDEPGQRVFDIRLQGATVAEDFDIVAEAGGKYVAYVAEFRDVPVERDLVVELVTKTGDTDETAAPLLNSIEVLK